MLLFIRSFQPERGKNREALAWAKDIAATMNQAISPARPCEVLTELFGENGRIFWLTGLQDWAEFERYRAWVATDPTILTILRRNVEEGLGVPDSTRITLLETT